MTNVSRYISNSDFAPRPGSVEPVKQISITLPDSVYIGDYATVEFTQDVSFDRDFDYAEYMLSSSIEPDRIVQSECLIYNYYYHPVDYYIVAYVTKLKGKDVRLNVKIISLGKATTVPTNSATFNASVLPFRSPFVA